MHKYLIKGIVSVTLALIISWLYLYTPQSFFSLDNRLRDFMFVTRGELAKNNRVVIVDIDKKALKEQGQWPWSRDVFAKLLYNLRDAGVGIIGLDVIFSEEDRSSPHRLIKEYPNLPKNLRNNDEVLAECFRNTPVIGGYFFSFEEGTEEKTYPMQKTIFVESKMKKGAILEPKSVVLNIEKIQDATYSSGFFNNIPDEEGMIRSVPLLMKYEGALFSSLSLEMVRIASGVERVDVIGDDAGVSSVVFGEFKIPTDKMGRLVINHRGAGKHFTYISAADILDGTFKKEDIAGKFVLVGTSAVGLHDIHSTPFDMAIPGVEIHANVIDNILEGDFLYKPADMVVYDLLIIFLIVFVLMFLFSFLSSVFILPVAIILLYALFELLFYLLFEYGVMLNLLFPLIAYSATLLASIVVDYIVTSAQKEEAKRMLGKKVSPAVMEYLLKHSSDDLVASSEVEATVFFSDIRDFTTISEKIGSPDRLIEMLNFYMTPMVETIIKRHGTIDKFIGDSIMAYWNAPLRVKSHADKALVTAIEQIGMLEEINKTLYKKYDVKIKIGIGLHTGLVTAGDMGAEGRSDYTIIGDNVNLASRLEGLTKFYGVDILISHATFLALEGSYQIRSVDIVEVKGKNRAVEIYEVICKHKKIEEREMQMYVQATELFREAKVYKAYALYEELYNLRADPLYKSYKDRCQNFIQNPSLAFSAVLKMSSK